jgi:uncharacterized membrane protein (DUF2068 family)
MANGGRRESSGAVVAIGVLKLLKGIVLSGAGLGAIKLLHGGANDLFEEAAKLSHLQPGGAWIQRAVAKVGVMSESQLKAVAFGTFAYAAIFLVEGAGLLARRHWAEWLTVIVTTSFIPLEIWHLVKAPGAAGIATVALNLAVVVYLVLRILHRRGQGRLSKGLGGQANRSG